MIIDTVWKGLLPHQPMHIGTSQQYYEAVQWLNLKKKKAEAFGAFF